MFTTLNRYAKAPTAGEIYLLEEDDVVAIVTRSLVFGHKLFLSPEESADPDDPDSRVRVNLKTSSLPERSKWFTTMKAVYDMVEILLRSDIDNDKVNPKLRPSDEVIDRYREYVWGIFDAFCGIDAYRAMVNGEHPDTFRRQNHLLFKPVGQIALAMGVDKALRPDKDQSWKGLELDEIVTRLNKIDWNMTHTPWANVIGSVNVEPDDQGNPVQTVRMLTAKERKELTGELIALILGYPWPETNRESIRKRYAEFVVQLPSQPDLSSFNEGEELYKVAQQRYRTALENAQKQRDETALPAAAA
jgi:hypothetical protein